MAHIAGQARSRQNPARSAISLALGGDCLADIAQLRAHPEVFGPVASDPTVSRLIGALAANAPAALSAIDAARATARAHAWSAARTQAPDHGIDEDHPLVVDIDATLVTAHSEKERAAPTSNAAMAFIHCVRSSTTAPAAPANRSRCCYARQCRLQHCNRSRHDREGRTRPVAVRSVVSGREEGAGAHRRGRRNPCVARVSDEATTVVFDSAPWSDGLRIGSRYAR